MRENKNRYQNSLASEKKIRLAFIHLLNKKDITQITVTDIIKEAKISRSTFYFHYQSAEKLYRTMENEIIDSILTSMKQTTVKEFIEDPLSVMLDIHDAVLKDQDFLSVLLKSYEANPFLYKLKKVIREYLFDSIDLSPEIKNSPAFHVRMDFYIGGLVNLYQKYLTEEIPYDLKDITHEVSKMVLDWNLI